MKKLILILFLTVSPAFAAVFEHKTSLSLILNTLPELKDVSLKFTQEKFIPTSNLTLKSGGDFKFEKDKGVAFYTTYPIKAVTTYSNKDYKQINQIISAISKKQFSALEKEFDFYFEEKGGAWFFGLKPKQTAAVSKYLTSIEIEGKTDISRITITQKDGVITTLRFSR